MTSEKNYERVLMEIDCVEKTVHLLQKLNYDSKGALKSGESQLGLKKVYRRIVLPKDYAKPYANRWERRGN